MYYAAYMHALTIARGGAGEQTRWQAVLLRAKARGWSQEKLAHKLGITQSHLSRGARGERTIASSLLPKAERLVGA